MRIRLIFLFILAISRQSTHAKTFILGDSLTCGSFGRELFSQFTKKDDQVVLMCAGSSRPEHWLDSENPAGFPCQTMNSGDAKLRPCGVRGEMSPLANLINQSTGAKVIIALGTNSLGFQKIDGSYARLAGLLAESASSCQWVGPPHLDSTHQSLSAARRGQIAKMDTYLSRFYVELENLVSKKCKIIDSRPFTKPDSEGRATTDGIHKTEKSGKRWAQEISLQL